MNVHSINHLCFSVSDLERSITFYQHVFDAKLKVKGRDRAYFDLDGLWISLNQEDFDRSSSIRTYTHIAFTIAEEEYESEVRRLEGLEVELFTGRPRDDRDKKSIYFLDPDGHMFELHTGTLHDRLAFYKSDMSHMEFYDET
jgi:metallothiol transferase